MKLSEVRPLAKSSYAFLTVVFVTLLVQKLASHNIGKNDQT